MRKVILFCVFCFILTALRAQSNRRNIDVITGKSILDSLPTAIGANSRNAQNDKVFGASNLIGVVVHRDYGTSDKVSLEVINNSLSVTKVSAYIAQLPANSKNYLVTQIQGYKALVQVLNSEISKTGYELLLPINNTLITFKAYGYTQENFLTMAKSIPVAMIDRKVK